MTIRLLAVSTLFVLAVGCKSSAKLFSRGQAPEVRYSDSIAFTRVNELIMVPVQINGKTYRFMLDTGAPMVISTEVAQALNMKKVARKNVGDSQGKNSNLNYYTLPDVQMSNQVFKDLVAIEADLQAVPGLACLQMDGFIGSNMLRHALITIDYQKNMLYFSNNFDSTTTDTNAMTVPFKTKTTYTPMIDLVVNTDTVRNITFDTGSGFGLTIPRNKAPETSAKSSEMNTSYGQHSSGLFGSVADTNYYTRANVTIAGKTVVGVPMSLEVSKSSSLLGTKFFENFRVELNWRTKEIKLTQTGTEFENTTYGFGINFTAEKLRISYLMQGSAAANLGFAVGDIVTAINGQDCQNISVPQYCEIIAQATSAKEDMQITLADKGTFTIAIEQKVK